MHWTARVARAGGILITTAGLAAGSLASALSGCTAIGPRAHVTYQGYAGAALVSADGRTLLVGLYSRSCSGPVSVVAKQTSVRVALFLRYVDDQTCFPGEGSMAMAPPQRVYLKAPLGHRKLVDGGTGHPTPWLSARLVLRPEFLPAGYRLTEVVPSVRGGGTTTPAPAACALSYQNVSSSQRDGPDTLSIVQSASGTLSFGPPDGWRDVTVRGRPGSAADGVLVWREDGLTYEIASYDERGKPALTMRQLIAIADSARPLTVIPVVPQQQPQPSPSR